MSIQQPQRQGDLLFVSTEGSRLFSNPEIIITCYDIAEITGALKRLEEYTLRGYYVAGFLAYEAGWAFLARVPTKQATEFPLLWFGVYKDNIDLPHASPIDSTAITPCHWKPAVTHQKYCRCIDAIRAYIGAGDAYQANFTFPMETLFGNDPLKWFWQLYTAQPVNHAAYLDIGRHKILSLSPELFFSLSGNELTTRPMKGTFPRGLYPEQDNQARQKLQHSEKDHAENLMIVDLLRNDMGKISEINSVQVASLFDIEQYATVWQMTSAIHSKTKASFSEIITALFPSGSVTGAPKIRAMEIIDEMESHPRGAYCGAIGWWGPERKASFNVAIRTITLDTQTNQAVYPVGGGITWYSNPEGEYAECLAKARTVMEPACNFSLLESLLYEDGFLLLEEHLDRLCQSAAYFAIPLKRKYIHDILSTHSAALSKDRWKVRLLIHKDGTHHIESVPAPVSNTMQVTLADSPISKENVFLYHKTTQRTVYEEARKKHTDVDDVILWNEAGEITESTMANVVVKLEDRLITPPVSCGLLAGVMRKHLLDTGEIEEGIIHKEDLKDHTKIFLINSVRGWMPAELINK